MAGFEDTIAALSTPAGISGVAVIRVSGPQAIDMAAKVFFKKNGSSWENASLEHRRLHYGTIRDDGGALVDEVVCGVMRGPESYTGEDVVEISCHGGTLVARKILEMLYSSGARPAGPGEFTRRSFLNGKIDLIQAEAVCDLINARSELQRKVAGEQLAGGLSKRINGLADELLGVLGEVEAGIDFSEEDIELLDRQRAAGKLGSQVAELDELLKGAVFSRPFYEGYRVAIAGPVNAGKSSLFNRLVGEERAIVTELPGTTRDVLREPVVLEGLLFLFQDTAGIRDESADRVERIGTELAKRAAQDADIVLFVHEAPLVLCTEEASALEKLPSDKTAIVLNKIDLERKETATSLARRFPRHPIVEVSALKGEGIERLKGELVRLAGREEIGRLAAERLIMNSRLVDLLRKARADVARTKDLILSGTPLEILAVELREALSRYETATGRRYSEDLLDNIFSRFCIGK